MRIRLLDMPPEFAPQRLDWDVKNLHANREVYDDYWKKNARRILSPELVKKPRLFVEVGAGSGAFLVDLARLNPDAFCIGVEWHKHRGKKLEHKAKTCGLPNIAGFRANVVPMFIDELGDESVDRIYQMYPCPWPKTAQRGNRWYLHPLMGHMLRTLKKGGVIVWTSDQKFFIDEAAHVCAERYEMSVITHGLLTPNEYNCLEALPKGRSAFEKHFFDQNIPAYELIVCKR